MIAARTVAVLDDAGISQLIPAGSEVPAGLEERYEAAAKALRRPPRDKMVRGPETSK